MSLTGERLSADRGSDPGPVGGPPERPASRGLRFLEAYAMLLLLGVIVLVFSVLPATADTFPTSGNFQAVVGNQAVVAVVALAALIPIICGEWDLSVGANVGLSAILGASAMSSGASVPVAVLLAVGVGLGIGVFNAIIVTRFRVDAIIGTLGTSALIAGAIQLKTDGLAVVENIPTSVLDFGSENLLGVPYVGWVLALVTAGVYYLMYHTPFGRYLYALGANKEAAKLVGLRTDRLVAGSLILAGGLCGIAGVLQIARSGGADPRVGEQFLLPAFAAAFLSAAAVRPGRLNVLGAIVAIFFLAALNAGLNLAGSETYVNNFVNGAALIIGVGLAAFLGRRRLSARST